MSDDRRQQNRKSINESKAEVISRINERLKADGIYDDSGGIFAQKSNQPVDLESNLQSDFNQAKISIAEFEKLPKYDARRGPIFHYDDFCVRLPREGTYRYDWSEYIWDTGKQVPCAGKLTIEKANQESRLIPEFYWSWNYSCQYGCESISGSSLAAFSESLSEAMIMSFDSDQFISSLVDTFKIRPYFEALQV
jgi:hypothetical protein